MLGTETKEISNNQLRLPDLARDCLILVITVAAALTVLTHIAQVLGIPFSTYVIIAVGAALLLTIGVLWNNNIKAVRSIVSAHPAVVLTLLMCCLMSSLVCLASHRPDMDDSYYVPNVVYYLEHPDEEMGFNIHFIDSGGEPFVSYHFGSFPFEYSQGILAHVLSTHYLNVYYLLVPALFGGMIPLVWFYLISRFFPSSRAAIAGACLVCLALLLMGEQHRSYGNFAFNRIFQGKTVMFTVGLPLFVALSVDFFHGPTLRRWFYLFLTSIAMVGFSTCAAVFIPVLALVLAAGCCFSYVDNLKSRFLRIVCYFTSLFYPVLYAITFLIFSLSQIGGVNPAENSWPANTFLEHVKFVLDGKIVLFLLISTTSSALLFVQKRDRRFLVIWIVSLIVLFLNPVVAPFIIKYVTTKQIYWRLLYLIPFPLVIGLSGAALAMRLDKLQPGRRQIIFVAVAVFLLLAHLPASSSSVFRHGPLVTRLGIPRYKANIDQARQVLELDPPSGTMLALGTVSRSLPLLTAKYPQLIVRQHGILMWMAQRGTVEEAVHRIRARYFLEGKYARENLESLDWVLRKYTSIQSVVAHRHVAEASDFFLFRLLKNFGFTEYKLSDDLAVFYRLG